MSITVKLRRGTTTQHSAFTGEEAEVTVDTTKDVVVVHDGVTVGGHPMVKASSLATVATTGDYNDLINTPSGTFLTSSDIGVTVQGYNANTVIDASYVHTDNNYTTAEQTKLAGIAAGAEVNVNADWNSISGDSQILNKPTLGTAAAAATTDFATAAQGTLADSAVQPAAISNMLETSDIGVTVQGYSAVLAGTTASFTTADETKLDGIASGAEVNVNADWNAVSGDAQILNKPTLYSDAAVDTHLNTSTATSAQVLSWTGTDYDWVTPSAGGGGALTISNKTGAYTVVAGDLGTIINCSGATSFTVSLTAAATLGSGFNCWIWNNTTTAAMVVTIDPNGAETIDGAATLILRRGEGTQIVCDGTNFQIGDKKAMRAYSENYSATAVIRSAATGNASLAIGANAAASGNGSLALGGFSSGPSASGIYAIAIGEAVTATSNYSTSIGSNSSAGGSQAVTGAGAMALGGSYASGADSFAAAIGSNTSSYGAKGGNSVAFGYLANASASSSIAISAGNGATASATGAIAIGGRNFGLTASGAGSCAIGDNVTATTEYAFAFGHRSTSVIYGKMAYASGYFAALGDAQTGTSVLRTATIDATASVLTSSGAAASTTNQIILPNNSACAFTGTIVARQQAAGGSNFAAWEIKGGIIRNGTAATTSLGSFNINTLSKTAGASAWTIALTADTTNGGLAITVTGAAATNIRWVATVQTSEVTYA